MRRLERRECQKWDGWKGGPSERATVQLTELIVQRTRRRTRRLFAAPCGCIASVPPSPPQSQCWEGLAGRARSLHNLFRSRGGRFTSPARNINLGGRGGASHAYICLPSSSCVMLHNLFRQPMGLCDLPANPRGTGMCLRAKSRARQEIKPRDDDCRTIAARLPL